MKVFYFFTLLFFNLLAQAYTLQITPIKSIEISTQEWSFGKGSLVAGMAPMNVYSHKKHKDQHILFEDLFLVKDTILSRVAPECALQLKKEQLTENSFCKTSQLDKATGKYSFTVTALFKTASPDIMKVKSFYFVGQQKNISVFEKAVDQKLAARTPAKVRTNK